MRDEGLTRHQTPVTRHWQFGVDLCLSAVALLLLALTASAAEPQRPNPLKSGVEFASDEVRKLQADDFGNPGMLWVARGEKLWSEAAGRNGKSCTACHGDAR